MYYQDRVKRLAERMGIVFKGVPIKGDEFPCIIYGPDEFAHLFFEDRVGIRIDFDNPSPALMLAIMESDFWKKNELHLFWCCKVEKWVVGRLNQLPFISTATTVPLAILAAIEKE